MTKTRNRNSTQYYDGVECKVCNTTKRQLHDNRCHECLKRRQDIYNMKGREKNFMQVHGVSYAQRDQMYADQNGLCLICKEAGNIDLLAKGASTKGRLFIDHCHDTGKVRGLICNACNIGLGVFKDNPEILEQATVYLRKHK